MSFWLFVLLVVSFYFLLMGGKLSSSVGDLFFLDKVGLFLSLISLLFSVYFLTMTSNSLSKFEKFCLLTSLMSSVLCFTSCHSMVFWVFYELTMLPLLVSIYVKSPYSERFSAGWYLSGYVLLTSAPLLFTMVYLSKLKKSYNFLIWSSNEKSSLLVGGVLIVLFITKVPLPPFHSWLPIVHAEASTFSSVALSGYVMKLGVVGLIRFCSNSFYLFKSMLSVMLFFSFLFFMASYCELDTKRWLAFLSLSHMLVAMIGLFYKNWSAVASVVYCLGHGISAGLLFYSFMLTYELTGTRNWKVMGLSDSVSKMLRISIVLGLLTVSSFPPSFSFMTEVYILFYSFSSGLMMGGFGVYLFLGGLIPMVLLSYFLSKVSVGKVWREPHISGITTLLLMFFIWLVGGLMV